MTKTTNNRLKKKIKHVLEELEGSQEKQSLSGWPEVRVTAQ